MELRFSAHGAYYHLYHIVWIPRYRKAILKGVHFKVPSVVMRLWRNFV